MFVKIVYNAYDVVQSKIFWNTGIGFSSKRRREKRGGLDKTRVKDALALVESYCIRVSARIRGHGISLRILF